MKCMNCAQARLQVHEVISKLSEIAQRQRAKFKELQAEHADHDLARRAALQRAPAESRAVYLQGSCIQLVMLQLCLLCMQRDSSESAGLHLYCQKDEATTATELHASNVS